MNAEERNIYDRARQKGFVEITGSGWRKQRSDAPLVNTYRSWCDANGHAAIYVHKANDGNDEVVVDLSPLRSPLDFAAVAEYCLVMAPDGQVATDNVAPDPEALGDAAMDGEEAASTVDVETGSDLLALESTAAAYRDLPIYRVPMFAVAWTRQRADAKSLAKVLAERLGTPSASSGGKSQKPKGRHKAPTVKPGKSRKSGGYGIG